MLRHCQLLSAVIRMQIKTAHSFAIDDWVTPVRYSQAGIGHSQLPANGLALWSAARSAAAPSGR